MRAPFRRAATAASYGSASTTSRTRSTPCLFRRRQRTTTVTGEQIPHWTFWGSFIIITAL